MFSKSDKIVTNKEEFSNYIEGLDIYNSKFLYELTRPDLEKEPYLITVYAYRPDLIAKDYYKDEGYEGIVMIQAGSLENLERGKKILLIPRNVVDNIISSL